MTQNDRFKPSGRSIRVFFQKKKPTEQIVSVVRSTTSDSSSSSSGGGESRTTVILLCEDGSLKIYMACASATEFWLTPPICHPMAALVNQAKPPRSKGKKGVGSLRGSGGRLNGASGGASSGPSFPIDFFEHCTQVSRMTT